MIAHKNCNQRILKVEEVGDHWRGQVVPSIRLRGKWLIKAGICPNKHVQVSNPEPSVLILHLLEEKT